MDDGGLLFWLIILAVAVLQGIGQRKKKAGQVGRRPPGGPGPRPVPGPPAGGEVGGRASTTVATPREGQKPGERASSEGMIPAEVWEEILGLARGQPAPAEVEEAAPVEFPSGPGEVRAEETRVRIRGVEGGEREGLPRAEETVPADASRAPREPPPDRPLPESHGADAPLHTTKPGEYQKRLGFQGPVAAAAGPAPAHGVRNELFGTGSPEELRKAIVLKEVLGPPKSLRE